jgi:hypothetical protein
MAIAATGLRGQGGLIGRQCEVLGLNLATDATSPLLDFSGAAGGNIFIPAGSPIITLTFFCSHASDQALVQAFDATGAAIVLTVAAGRSYPFPVDCYGLPVIQLRANSAGHVDITLKG